MSDRKSVLITGGTRGIGRACVDALADDWHVIVGGRDESAVRSLVESLPSAAPFVADLGDEHSTAAAVEALGLDRLDGLVHSAGVAGGAATPESNRAMWRNMLELNVIAVSELTRLLLPALVAAQGTIVTINSGSGLRASGKGGHYPASKFALTALTDVLREELRPDGVRVSSVHPGRVDTDMQRELVAGENRAYDPEEFLRPESVAVAVRTALTATPDATYETISIRPGPAATNRRTS
ncbi:NADP-dependent 3-hydroxy acid dehydrogenase YdfG [Barrientosiimonas humi]|uniref:NADP-dependent 3-hydroxy acid dehydrogenase YdfG n=2 Tax=Barrientosiimonas TaxID=1535207 RepID=A0A542X8Y1_9MICO|nr:MULTISPECIES: SDR family oxidoreductase [Barrientosiimonas]TQL32292.1 NADP-dependent 3-hydroxy acid dehydrogenase YdfG [Barrientosiimonas humi]BDZ57032.1 short chain dehydrogenase [Barrientosiimonas endolithica]CAG7572280.1 Serine 3-dehydrogenase [Barrientosiimonas humi]